MKDVNIYTLRSELLILKKKIPKKLKMKKTTKKVVHDGKKSGTIQEYFQAIPSESRSKTSSVKSVYVQALENKLKSKIP